MKTKTIKTLKIIGNVLLWLFVAFAILMTVFALAAQSSSTGVPTLGGKMFLTVQSPSMEPAFSTGDLILGQELSAEEKAGLKVGDVITYRTDLNGDGKAEELNTHRIVSVREENGYVYYKTKGDNNPVEDNGEVSYADVVAKWTGTRLSGIGSVINFLQSPKGFLIVIVLPMVLFFLYELYVFIRTLLEVKNRGKKQITEADEELIKQRAVEEYLRQQAEAAAKAGEASGTADTAASDVTETNDTNGTESGNRQ